MPIREGERDHRPRPRPGPLMIIGGAEDKLRRRSVLSTSSRPAVVPDARIAVIADRVVPRPRDRRGVRRPLPQAGCRRRRRRAAGEPRGRPRPGVRRPARRRDRHLHDRRQPAQAVRDRQRHRRSATRSTPPGPAVPWSRGTSAGASIQSSHMVAFGVGGATPKQRMTQVAAGPRPGQRVRDRPALRPAQPLRPAADDRRPVPAAARDRRRRGHRRGGHRRAGGPRSCGSSAAAR